MLDPGVRETYRFRDVSLDVAAYELRRNGAVVRLERQPMELLILLVRHHGRLVTRSQIQAALWGPDVFVEVESGVHTAVRKVRQALRDSPEAPAFIETVPGRGYRFIAPLDAAEEQAAPPLADAASPAVASAPPTPGVPRWPATRTRRWLVGVSGFVLLAVLAVVTARVLRSPPPVTIAVLPLQNLSLHQDTAYLADGLVEDTIASLGRIDPERVSVIGRTTMLAYRHTTRSLAEIGRELGADYVVEGSFRTEDGRIRVTSRLVRASDQVQVWTDSFDREVSSALDVQQALSHDIAEQVRIRLLPDRQRALTRRHSRVVEAYDQFVRGRSLFYQRSPEAMRHAIEAYQRAVELDPEYALAWAGLATALAGSTINSDAEPRVVGPRAQEAAERAVRLDPELAEAQFAIGYVHWIITWDWPAAEDELRRAIALDPNSSLAHQTLGHLLSQSGRHAPALASMARARALDPLNPVPHALSSQVAFQARDRALALAHARRAIAIDPAFWFGHQMLAQVQEQSGAADDSLGELATAIRFSGRNSKPLSLRAYVLERTGRREEARELVAAMDAAARERYVPPYAFALAQAGLGNAGDVFPWLDRAVAARDVHLIYLPQDPKWDRYRGDARFVAVLARCGFTTDPVRPTP